MLFNLVSFAARPSDTLSVGSLEFVPNVGQSVDSYLYSARLRGGALFAEKGSVTFAMISPTDLSLFHQTKYDALQHKISKLNASAYRISFVGSNPNVNVLPIAPYQHYYNFFHSHQSERWRSHVTPYAELLYSNLYDGISLHVYQSGDNLKYDVLVSPNANPALFVMSFDGVKSVSLSGGNLYVDNFYSRIIELAPIAYQIVGLDTVFVDCHYVLKSNSVSFALGDYRHDLPLVIDPTVVFSSFSGSTADNWGYTATYDADGNLYGGGVAFGVGYPTTLGAYQIDFCAGVDETGITDIAISKFNSSGSQLLYSTYLGGSWVDIPHSLYVNENNELYIMGTTGSANFPVTEHAFDTTFNGGTNVTLSTALSFPNGSDLFIAKLSADGTQLLASTFVGGSKNDGINVASSLRKNYADENRGEILVDLNSNVYVVSSTWSSDFPVTTNAYSTTANEMQDVCLFKMSQDLSQLIWSTYFGGVRDDAGYSMSLAADGSVYFCGGTLSPDLATTQNAVQPQYGSAVDGFVAHLSPNGDQLLHCTYLGKVGYDQAYLVKMDRNGFPHVFGQTAATDNAWVVNADYSVPGGGQFLTKLSLHLDSVIWSTAFGTGQGGPDLSPTALMVDYCNSIYMSGWGSGALNGFGGTAGLPITPDAFQSHTDGNDYYFICIAEDASQLVYGTFFGGGADLAREHVDGGTSRFDRKGRIYQAVCAGCGGQSTFPTTNGAWSQTNGSSNCNLGVIKMDFGLPVVVADFQMPNAVCLPDTVHFHNCSQTVGNSTTCLWNFGDGTTSTLSEPTHFYAHSGYYTVTLVVQDNSSCNFADTLEKSILVLANATDTLPTLSVCAGDFIQIGLPPSLTVDYQWTPPATLSSDHISNPMASPLQSTRYTLVASSGSCRDTLYQQVEVSQLQVTTMPDTTICKGTNALLWVVVDSADVVTSMEWSMSPDFTNVFNIGQSTLLAQPDTTTTYYIRVRSISCVVVLSITVFVSEVHITSAPDRTICFEEGVTLQLQHDAGEGCQYRWELGDGTVYTTAHPFVSPVSSTSYSVTVTNSYGCTAVASGNIVCRIGTFSTPLEVWCDINHITQGDTITLYSTDYGDGYTYQWQPEQNLLAPTAPSTIAYPIETTLYTMTVTDTFNCSLSDTVSVKVDMLTCDDPFVFVPNAFSPNGDNLNDILYVRSKIVDELYFVVYSRWGQKLFESHDVHDGWDGTFKGKPCQNGVYDYYLKGRCIDGQLLEMKGNVMLIR